MVLLNSAIKGAAAQWVGDHHDQLGYTYEEMKGALRREYTSVFQGNVARLKGLQYRDDLHKFNTEFAKIGSTCRKECPEGI